MRSTLRAIEISVEGLELAQDAMSAAWPEGYAVMNDGEKRTFFMCKNGSGAPMTMTIQTYATRDDLPVADRVIEIAVGARLLIGPFTPAIYNDTVSRIYVDFSSVTDVTFGAFKLKG